MGMSSDPSASTAWLLAGATGLLAVVVLALVVLVVRQSRRIGVLEERLGQQAAPTVVQETRTQPAPAEYVITHVGGRDVPAEEAPAEPAAAVGAPVFADLLLKETVVQTASLFHGLRRALSPETRNRIRFHMRQEVKRSRKQRKAELREVRRQWAARQRDAMAAEDAGTTAA